MVGELQPRRRRRRDRRPTMRRCSCASTALGASGTRRPAGAARRQPRGARRRDRRHRRRRRQRPGGAVRGAHRPAPADERQRRGRRRPPLPRAAPAAAHRRRHRLHTARPPAPGGRRRRCRSPTTPPSTSACCAPAAPSCTRAALHDAAQAMVERLRHQGRRPRRAGAQPVRRQHAEADHRPRSGARRRACWSPPIRRAASTSPPREAVYAALHAALARGAAVVLISTDLDEIVARAHRVAVLYRGRLSAPLERPFPVERLGLMMAGERGGVSLARLARRWLALAVALRRPARCSSRSPAAIRRWRSPRWRRGPSAAPTRGRRSASAPARCCSPAWRWRSPSAPASGTSAPRGSCWSARRWSPGSARRLGGWPPVLAIDGGARRRRRWAARLWAGIAGVLRTARGVDEVISTIMLNFIALGLVGWLVHGPLMEAAGAYPQTDAVADGGAPAAPVQRLPRARRAAAGAARGGRRLPAAVPHRARLRDARRRPEPGRRAPGRAAHHRRAAAARWRSAAPSPAWPAASRSAPSPSASTTTSRPATASPPSPSPCSAACIRSAWCWRRCSSAPSTSARTPCRASPASPRCWSPPCRRSSSSRCWRSTSGAARQRTA